MKSDNQFISIDGLENTRQAMLNLVETTQRSLHLYTPFVDPRLYNDGDIVDAIRARVVNQPRIRFYLLLPSAHDWRSACPRLLQLTERLSSALELRTLPQEEPRERPEFTQSFIIADHAIVLHEADPRHHIGRYEPHGAGEVRKLMNFFQEIWEKSQPDLELRSLKL
jgi:hypothetical protein